jgi:hypothetical protein
MKSFPHVGILLAAFFAAASLQAATRYDGDGVFSNAEELQRWYINRARFAPEAEADRLSLTNAADRNYDACEGFTDGSTNWPGWVASKPPLAPNANLRQAALKHAEDMAETGVFSHYSPSTNFYPLNSDPFYRMAQEGYNYSYAGESISSGWRGSTGSYPSFGLSALDSYESLFVDIGIADRGHRKNIIYRFSNPNAFREIGVGTWRSNVYSAPWYKTYDYYTEDFASSNGVYFFTDTIFTDTDSDQIYDEGEGLTNIEIRLFKQVATNLVEGTYYDVSSGSGNFAVPIAGFTAGDTIVVQLVNVSGSTRTLCIPTGFNTRDLVTLTNGQAYTYKQFTQPTTWQNVGFRNLQNLIQDLTITASAGPNGSISPSGTVSITSGSDQIFTITPALYHYIASISVDGTNQGTGGTYTFTNVTSSHTISAVFAENLTSNGVPETWLASYGLTNGSFEAESMSDTDGDGLTAWEEYIAGTDPTNAASVLQIDEFVTTPLETFYDLSLAAVTARQYSVQCSTDLNLAWTNTVFNLTTNGNPTNSCPGSGGVMHFYVLPPGNTGFYRITVTK